jgi:hypothetical protein
MRRTAMRSGMRFTVIEVIGALGHVTALCKLGAHLA